MNEPEFSKGDKVKWIQKPWEVRVVLDEPMWDGKWECFTYWLGGPCRFPESQIEAANGPTTLDELAAATRKLNTIKS